MPFFHVNVFEYNNPTKTTGYPELFLNLSEQALQTRIVEPWDRGSALTWSGETVRTAEAPFGVRITIYETDQEFYSGGVSDYAQNLKTLKVIGRDVTNAWITRPAGEAAVQRAGATTPRESAARDHGRVMVVYGRNLAARDAMFMFLRALGLRPIEWEQAIGETGVGSPHNLDAVYAAMEVGQAVVVLLTGEDEAKLLDELAGPTDADELLARPQPRQNVILEAGLAMGIDRARLILVELGDIRRASDFGGRNVVRISNASPTREALRGRLIRAGCAVDETASDYLRPEAAGDFEACVVRPSSGS